jgi:hypothetical protein
VTTDTETAFETGDFDVVLSDPAAFFGSPQAILDDATLSTAEMQQLLTAWRQDLADRHGAADEGMLPDVPGIIEADVRLGEAIVAALATIEARTADEDSRPNLPTRIWRRLTGKG